MATQFISSAQNLTFYGFLPALNQTGKICNKINYNFFASTTIDAFKQTTQGINYPSTDFQLYIQPSIIYVPNNNWNFSGSYTYQRNNPFRPNATNEHRIWEQCVYGHLINKARMTHRIRFEERFIENLVLKKYPFATRLRYQIGYNIPLKGKTLDAKEFYMNMSNEFYFSLTGNKNATYSENWSYLGIGYLTPKLGRVEIGFLHQEFVRNLQHNVRYLNLLQVQWITNFNLKRKKD
jgi:hypothetical protein